MKVYIGPFKDRIGPYQIADLLKYIGVSDDARWKIGKFLSDKTPLNKICEYVHSKRIRRVKVVLHPYDTWNVDSTLAIIILPLLKQLSATQHGAPSVDDEDVPEFLQRGEIREEDKYTTDKRWFARWDWVMSEMIWTFEQLQPGYDWEDKYWIVKPKLDLTRRAEDEGKPTVPVRWAVEGQLDREGYEAHQNRIKNGLRLFGKYYLNLWD